MNQTQNSSDSSKTMFGFGLVTGIAIAAVLAVVFMLNSGGAVVATDTGTTPTPTNTAPTPTEVVDPAPSGSIPEVTDDDWVRGDLASAKVVMVEYSDFECPFCSRHHPSMTQVMDNYGDDVAWVYRHFPLSFHAEAQPSALASECVGAQLGDEGFWSFADKMFEDQGSLGAAYYEQVAGDLGADMAAYRTCVEDGEFNSKITQQQAGGSAAGARGTPATFINGQLVSGAVPYAQIEAIIQGLL